MQTADDELRTLKREAAPAWYALYTRHQHEKSIANMLTNRGFEVFLPLYLVGHQWKDRTKQLSLPLFPTYVFLWSCLGRRVDVLKTPGVYQFVGFGGMPCAIPTEEIESVRRVVTSALSIEPHPFLKCGDRVRIKSGSLAGVEGILVRKKNLFRLVLSVELLNRAVALEVDVTKVERLAKQNSLTSAHEGHFSSTDFSRATGAANPAAEL
jgi:transcription antitermination factor NusG